MPRPFQVHPPPQPPACFRCRYAFCRREARALDWEAERPGLLHYFRHWPDFCGWAALIEEEWVGLGWGTRTGPGEWLHDRLAAQLGGEHPSLQEVWLLNVLAVQPPYQLQREVSRG
jgi:hypothetical protein